MLKRIDLAHSKAVAAGTVKALQMATEDLTVDNLGQAKIRLSNAKTNVRNLSDENIKAALNELIDIEEAKILEFEEAQRIIDLVNGVEAKLIKATSLEEADALINDAYKEVRKLPFGSELRTRLNNMLVALAESNVIARRLEETDYVAEFAKDRTANNAQTTLNNLQKDVDKMIIEFFKNKYGNIIDAHQIEVNKMFTATAAVNTATISQLQEDVNSAQELIDELINGYVKQILGASNAVTKAEISKLKADLNSAQELVTALPYNKERTPLQKRLDAIVTGEQEALASAIKAAEDAIAALPSLEDVRIEDKQAVLDAKALVEAVKALDPNAVVTGEELIDPLLAKIGLLEDELTKPYVKSVTHDIGGNGDFYRLSEWGNLPEVNSRGYFYKLNFKFKDGTERLTVGNPVGIKKTYIYNGREAEEIENFDVIIFQANGQFGPFVELLTIKDVPFEGPNEYRRKVYAGAVAVGKAERAKIMGM